MANFTAFPATRAGIKAGSCSHFSNIFFHTHPYPFLLRLLVTGYNSTLDPYTISYISKASCSPYPNFGNSVIATEKVPKCVTRLSLLTIAPLPCLGLCLRMNPSVGDCWTNLASLHLAGVNGMPHLRVSDCAALACTDSPTHVPGILHLTRIFSQTVLIIWTMWLVSTTMKGRTILSRGRGTQSLSVLPSNRFCYQTRKRSMPLRTAGMPVVFPSITHHMEMLFPLQDPEILPIDTSATIRVPTWWLKPPHISSAMQDL